MHTRNASLVALALALVTSTGFAPAVLAGVDFNAQHIVVANRGSASISVIDVASSDVVNIPMPAGANTPDPMYFWYSSNQDLLYVGDRANDRVVAFNPRDYSVVNPGIPAGDGIFHMWGSPTTDRLWVVNDTPRMVSVIDLQTMTNIGSFATPGDLGPDAIPHDIILEPDGSAAYVTIQNSTNATNDFVVKYSNAAGFPEVDRQGVGKAPHAGLTFRNNVLYTPAQGSNRVDVLDRTTLDPAAPPIPMASAHGIESTNDGNTMYMTSFPGDGTADLHVIDPFTHTLINSVDTPVAGVGPHNVLTSPDDTRLYITHTGGTSTTVSVFDISGANRTNPVSLGVITVGLNPFAIGSVPEIPEPATGALVLSGAMAVLTARRRRR